MKSLPKFGAFIEGHGGHFAAIMRGHAVSGVEQPPYALLVSGMQTGETASPWGEYGKDIPGTASRRDGKPNTEAMAQALCPAALQVYGKVIDGHADWFLPSLGEMNSAAANVPELFDPKGIYWTSTQLSRNGAFVQDFELGGSYWLVKYVEFRVRAFRAIPLELLMGDADDSDRLDAQRYRWLRELHWDSSSNSVRLGATCRNLLDESVDRALVARAFFQLKAKP